MPVQIILVGVPEAPDLASNKRVKGHPPPAPPIPQKSQWPLNQQPPDADARRHLDDARRAIASRRPEIERFLRASL